MPASRASGVVDVEWLIAALGRAAADAGVDAYIAGGFVRDRLRGRPGRDLDLVVLGRPGGTAALLRRLAVILGWPEPELFEAYGTGKAAGDGFVVEAVEARVEEYDAGSRRPRVRPGTLEEDVWRRDFTVNTLLQTFGGQVLDLTGRGLRDLVAGVLRTPLDPSRAFEDDPLRMLRAARFASVLDARADDQLLAAMRERASRVELLSAERVRDELRGLLRGRRPSRGIEVLREGSLLGRLLPELEAMRGVEQSGWHTHDVYGHTLAAVDGAPPDLVTRAAVLLHDVGKPPCHAIDERGRHTFHDHPQVGAEMAERLLARLSWPADETAEVTALIRLHLRPIQYDAGQTGDSAVRRLIRDAGALRSRMLDVARADIRASAYPTTAGIDELAERMERLDGDGAVSARRRVLDGSALMREFGRGPGPWIGAAQRALEEAVVEGEVRTDDAEGALRWLRERRPDLVG